MVVALAGCGKSKEQKAMDELATATDNIAKSTKRMERDAEKEKALWADFKTAYPVIKAKIHDRYPYARDCRFDDSTFRTKELPNKRLQITGDWLGKDEEKRPARVSWKAELYLIGGEWQVMVISLTDKKPL
jgi:hypothetical protein